MQKELRDKIRAATKSTGITKPDFVDLLSLIDRHYDKMEATITQSMRSPTQTNVSTPIEAIFDSVTNALLSVDDDGLIRNCNKVSCRYFKLNKEEMIGSHLRRLLPSIGELSVARFLEPFISNLEDTNIDLVNGEVTAQTTDGDHFIAELNASCIESVSGDIFVISLCDVTDRKQTESALKENEERYRALVENAPEAIIVFDVDRNVFTDANDNACILFNLSRARLLSVGPEAISPDRQPDGSPSFGVTRGFIDRALNGGHPSFEWMHQDSNGKELPCEVRFSRLPSDSNRLIRVSITDIADRKREEALAYAQNKVLEMIASSAPHDKTLRAICRFVERLGNDFKAAIMELDGTGQTLSVEQAPGLDEKFQLGLDFVRVEKNSLTCGSAVHGGTDRVTTDIGSDPGWEGKRKLAAELGIKANWSFLIHGSTGSTIGTLDVFLNESRSPTTHELDKLSGLARLAGIAIKRQRDEDKLRTSEARYRGLFENVVDGVYIASREGEIITANPALVEMLGYDSVEEMQAAGKTSVLYVNPVDRERVFARLETEGVVKNFEYRLRRKDGSEIVVLDNSRAILGDDGEIVAHEGSLTDITERKRAETRVFEEKERAQVTLQSIGDGVITTDADGRVDYINPVAQDLTGWDMRSARDTPISDIMMIINEHTRASVENPVIRCLKEGRTITLADNSVLITKNGDEVPIQDSAAPIRDRIGNIVGSVMVFHDIGKESRLFRQLSYQSSHDSLTGLINRREFENCVGSALEKTRGNEEAIHALLYVDLDQFKVVNDTFGHTAGDALLCQLSEKIQANVRSSDLLARLGGDEFGIFLEHCSKAQAIEVAEAIRSAVEGYRFEWKNASTTIRCSIGVVMVSDENADIASIMSSADVACYSAKDMGRNQVHLYKDSDASMRHEEMKWVSRITSAIDDERLELFYQPIIGIGNEHGQRRGHYELLLRMRDEEGELVGPEQFIPAAERYNLMSTVDRWVVREAVTKLADRNDADVARYTLAVNLSGTSLSEDRFWNSSSKSCRIKNCQMARSVLKSLRLRQFRICPVSYTSCRSSRSRGCKFSLDDFGSGLSSFHLPQNLPVDYLKIDGQFIRNVVDDAVDESMVKAISQVGHAMGIEIIAERVESREVMDKLATLGIEFAQGFYIARPESVDSFEPWAGAENQRLA